MDKGSVQLVRYQCEPVDINLRCSREIKGNRVSALRITSVERGMGVYVYLFLTDTGTMLLYVNVLFIPKGCQSKAEILSPTI